MRRFHRKGIDFWDTLRRIDHWTSQASMDRGPEGAREMLDFFIDMITDDIRTSAAQRALPGRFEVDVYPLSEHSSDVSTDGQTWFVHDGKTRSYPVSDVRLALLFELARRRTKAAQATAAKQG